MTRTTQESATSANNIVCNTVLYSDIATHHTCLSLLFIEEDIDLAELLVDVLIDGRLIGSVYCKQNDNESWSAFLPVSSDNLIPGHHKIEVNLEGMGTVLSDEVVIPLLLVDAIVSYTVQVQQEGDTVVIELAASSKQASFPFDLYCDQHFVASYHPVIGDMVNGLRLRFALPQQLLVAGPRLFTLISKQGSIPTLEAECYLHSVDVHQEPFKVAIVDCSLRRAAGHMYNTVNRMAACFANLGGKVEVFNHVDFRADTLPYHLRPTFRHSCYDAQDTGLLPLTEEGTRDFEIKMKLVNSLFEELVAITPQLTGRQTIIVFPTVTPLMFFVIAKWAAQKPDDGSQVILGLMLESGVIRVTASRCVMPYPALLVSAGMSLLSKRVPRDVHLWCVSDQLKSGYDHLAQQFPSVVVERRPNFFVDVNAEAVHDTTPRHTLLFVGEAKRDKGFRLLPSLLRAIRERPELKGESLVVHHVGQEEPDAVSVVAELMQELRRESFNVHRLTGFLDEFSYRDLISSSKLILVRYDRAHYWEKSSGITWEALSFGVPIVTYRNSFMAEETARFGLPTYLVESDDPSETLEAIDKALARRHEDAPLCAAAAALFRRENGADSFAAMAVDLMQNQSLEQARFNRLTA